MHVAELALDHQEWMLDLGPDARLDMPRFLDDCVVADQLRERFPKLGSLIEKAEHDVLAFMAFPRAHWSRIYSTNPLERLNADIKRRTNVVGIFPNDAAITRLVGAMMLEQNDEWSLNRRYMQLEGLQSLCDTAPTRLSAVAR